MTRAPEANGGAWLAVTAVLCLGAIAVAIVGTTSAAWPALLELRPGLRPGEAWRLWTCAWVHWSGPHLAVNLAGAVVVGAVGWRARASRAAALAWFAAWPLTHLAMAVVDGLQAAPPLQHYGGLSGVLHAGVIVLGLSLAWPVGAPSTRADGIDGTSELAQASEGPWAMTTLEELSTSRLMSRERHSAFDIDAPLAPLTRAQARRHRVIGVGLLVGTLAKVLLETPWDQALRPNALLGIQVAPLAHACGIAAGVLAWIVFASPSRRP